MLLNLNTFPTAEQNLAFDEALIEQAESMALDGMEHTDIETLRLWEMPNVCVIVGRASKLNEEVDLLNCEHDGIPVFRRCSGGASVVAGPGCLMYSMLLSYQLRPQLRLLDVAHRECMSRVRNALLTMEEISKEGLIELQGTCDLTFRQHDQALSDGRKFSGNALRCKRNWMLYHGTILYNFPVHLVSRYLRQPPRQPAYRSQRSHDDFVTNLPLSVERLRAQLAFAWEIDKTLSVDIGDLEQQRHLLALKLLESRYGNPSWHNQR